VSEESLEGDLLIDCTLGCLRTGTIIRTYLGKPLGNIFAALFDLT
jgi:hypothetical protein